MSATPDNHVEQVMQDRARTLSETLKDDRKVAQALARKLL
jgi:hypothetical protein